LAEAAAAFGTPTPAAGGGAVARAPAVSSHPLPQPRSRTASAAGDASITASRSRVEPSSLLTPEKQAPWALTSSSPTPGWVMVPCLGKTDRLGADRGLVAMIIRCLPTPGETSTRPNP